MHLSLAEVVTLWISARLSQAASDLPWSGAADSALSKLLASLPKARAAQLRSLCRRVVIGPPASDQLRVSAGRPPRELLRLVEVDPVFLAVGCTFQGIKLELHLLYIHGIRTIP